LHLRGGGATPASGSGAPSAIPVPRPMSGLSVSGRISDEVQPESEPLADVPFPAQSQVLCYLAERALRRCVGLRIGALARALAVSPTPTGRIVAWR